MTPQDDRPRMEDNRQLEAELQDLMEQVQSLHLQTENLQHELQQSHIELTEKERLGNDAEMRLRQEAEAAHKQLQSLLQESERQTQLLEQALMQQEGRLKELAADVEKGELTLDQLRRDLEKERKQKQAYQQQLDELRESMAELQKKALLPEVQPKPVQKQQPKKQQEGFSLRFHNAAALQSQVAKGRVKFYAIIGKETWGIKLGGRLPVWNKTTIPGSYHHMSAVTVPSLFSRSFRAQVSARGSAAITWGVTLPPRIRSRINTLMQGKKGGDLIIDGSGHVTINP